VIFHPQAAYTDEARQRGIQGSVIVWAQFDEDVRRAKSLLAEIIKNEA
jgi:hypothetical protein